MTKSRAILAVDFGSPTFQKTFKKLAPNIQKEFKRAAAELFLLDIDHAPGKLHLHQLTNKSVCSAIDSSKKVPVYTIHITSNDSYKASFTYENQTAYFRVCGEHNEIDKNP